MNSKFKTGIALFICICLGLIAYVQVDKHLNEKKVEAEIKTHNEETIKNIEKNAENFKKSTPQRGTL